MHTDPKLGVVDPSCKVHSVANLYIGGSAVFPTTGTSTPTFTIVALALRLADHLRREVLV
jgi:choline dehydrogenase-like flavoprotein